MKKEAGGAVEVEDQRAEPVFTGSSLRRGHRKLKRRPKRKISEVSRKKRGTRKTGVRYPVIYCS
jgi:hypothetical protein